MVSPLVHHDACADGSEVTMFMKFINTHFLSIMADLLKSKNIEPVFEEKLNPEDLHYEDSLDCIGSNDYYYFAEAISRMLIQKDFKLASPDLVVFKTVNPKGKGIIREDIFALKKELNSYSIMGKTPGTIKKVQNQVFFGDDGIPKQFDIKCKEYLDSAFQKGLLAFSNYYNSQLRGLEWLESEINSDITKEVNNFKATGVFDDDDLIKKLFSRFESGQQNFYDNYKFSLFIMSVYSFIEHVAVLVLPFWFAMKDSDVSWNLFCKGFNPSGYDTFRDFWTSKEDWINSFIEVISDCTKWKADEKRRVFSFSANDDQKLMKRLYDRTRADYRNPIHHGFSTGRDKTGLSMEVPTLDTNKKLNFFDPPLLREIDSKAYQDTKDFLDLFIKVLKEKHPSIMDYIETGWNVPTDCSELCKYISEGKLYKFIDTYETILSHVDYEQLAGIYR